MRMRAMKQELAFLETTREIPRSLLLLEQASGEDEDLTQERVAPAKTSQLQRLGRSVSEKLFSIDLGKINF